MVKTENDRQFAFLKPTAILIDGAFFLKRYRCCFDKNHSPDIVAKNMYTMCMKHVQNERLYRILYYDCLPLDIKMKNPINSKEIDFSKTQTAIFRQKFLKELKKLRKVAIRLGFVRHHGGWIITPKKTKELLSGKIKINDLSETDIIINAKQKGVDIKIGLDIASLAYKKLVDKIILISGDSDFVPAAKLARREGIDFVLDPMWQQINDALFEHIDGLNSTCKNPN